MPIAFQEKPVILCLSKETLTIVTAVIDVIKNSWNKHVSFHSQLVI